MWAGAGLVRSGQGGEALPPEPRFPLQRGQMPPLAWDTSGTSHLLPPLGPGSLGSHRPWADTGGHSGDAATSLQLGAYAGGGVTRGSRTPGPWLLLCPLPGTPSPPPAPRPWQRGPCVCTCLQRTPGCAPRSATAEG